MRVCGARAYLVDFARVAFEVWVDRAEVSLDQAEVRAVALEAMHKDAKVRLSLEEEEWGGGEEETCGLAHIHPLSQT